VFHAGGGQGVKDLDRTEWWPVQSCAHAGHRLDEVFPKSFTDEADERLIRGLDLNLAGDGRELHAGEVSEVPRHHCVCPGFNGGGEVEKIVRIGP